MTNGDSMRLTTFNSFGKITISKKAIAKVVAFYALDCYGVVELQSPNFIKITSSKKNLRSNGVIIRSSEQDIVIDIFVVLKYGIAISAVSDSIKKSVKYNVENFTGMIVREINVYVVGVRV